MKAITEGVALERFKEEWTRTGEILAAEIGTFLDETEARRFLAAREQGEARWAWAVVPLLGALALRAAEPVSSS